MLDNNIALKDAVQDLSHSPHNGGGVGDEEEELQKEVERLQEENKVLKVKHFLVFHHVNSRNLITATVTPYFVMLLSGLFTE